MWQLVAFTWPDEINGLGEQATVILSNASAEIGSSKSLLELAPTLDIENNPVSEDATGALAELTNLVDIALDQVRVLCVHPWHQGVGQGNGHYRYLSPANAITAAAEKFTDQADRSVPDGIKDALVVLLSAQSFSSFAETLKLFNTVFRVPELELCERRSKQLATAEKDKQSLPEPSINARWRDRKLMNIFPARVATTVVGELLAHAVAYEAGGQSAVSEVISLADKKNAAIADTQTTLANIASTFSGGAGQVLFINNKTTDDIKKTLEASGINHDAPLSACLMLTAKPGDLQIVAEILGL